MIKWLRLLALNSGDLGLIPAQGTRSHMLKLNINYKTKQTDQNTGWKEFEPLKNSYRKPPLNLPHSIMCKSQLI